MALLCIVVLAGEFWEFKATQIQVAKIEKHSSSLIDLIGMQWAQFHFF